ncbi:MAG: phosphoenolpyruvate carboxylase [Deferrisomatales bacterium]
MFNHPDLSDRELASRLPHTLGTQHPDNASPVPFGSSPRVDRQLEEEEVLYNVMTLGLPEVMIDYEKKQGGCTPLWDWLHRCPVCLEEKVIGRDFRVTPRVPNGDADRDDPYFWQAMGIFVHSLLVARRMGVEGMPFSEFIVPDAERGATVARTEAHIAELYRLQRTQYRQYGDGSPFPYGGEFFAQGIPLIETVERLLDPAPVWDALVAQRKKLLGRDTYVQRSFIARSDPALKAGLLPALLAAAVALAQGREYERRTGVRIAQIVGIGSAPFRGGLIPEPERLDAVLATYPGMATVTLQSAFRYDYPEGHVVAAARHLETRLAEGWMARHELSGAPGPAELAALRQIAERFRTAYEGSYREILPAVRRVAQEVPSRRDRYRNVALTGEVRRVGGLPAVRAIRFAASCYSLGLAPGVLGWRAWAGLDAPQRRLVERICPTARYWLREELRWLHPELPTRWPDAAARRALAEDAEAARAWAGAPEADGCHVEAVERVLRALNAGEPLTPWIEEAARVRRFLG